MKKRLLSLLFCIISLAFCSTASAASVVIIFSPETEYMDPEFYKIVEKYVSRYTKDYVLGPEIDAAYVDYLENSDDPRAGERWYPLPEFAEEYGCDLWISLTPRTPTSWGGTHLNAHTGEATGLGSYSIRVQSVIYSADRVSVRNLEIAGYSSNYGRLVSLKKHPPRELILESFDADMDAIIDRYKRYLRD